MCQCTNAYKRSENARTHFQNISRVRVSNVACTDTIFKIFSCTCQCTKAYKRTKNARTLFQNISRVRVSTVACTDTIFKIISCTCQCIHVVVLKRATSKFQIFERYYLPAINHAQDHEDNLY